MNQIISFVKKSVLAIALLTSFSLYAESPFNITPAPGVVSELSEFLITFNGDWALGTNRSGKIVIKGPAGVTIPKIMSASMGASVGYIVYFEDDAVVDAPGDYTMTIPANKFEVNGTPIGETVFEYTVEAAPIDPTIYTGRVNIDPAPGIYKHIDSFTLSFDADATVAEASGIKLTGPEGEVELNAEADGTDVVITPAAALTVKGDYKLSLEAAAISIEGKKSPELTYGYTIGQKLVNGLPVYTVDPAPGTYDAITDGIHITFDSDETVKVSSNSIFLSGPSGDLSFVVDIPTDVAAVNIIPVDVEGNAIALTEAGKYQIIVMLGAIHVGDYSNEEPLVFNYNVIGNEEPKFEYTYSVTPADGEKLGADESISITFAAEGLTSVVRDEYAWGKSAPHFTNDLGAYNPTLTIVQDEFTLKITHEWPFEADGLYKLVIPAQYLTLTNADGDKVKNDTIEISYLVSTSSIEAIINDNSDTQIYNASGLRFSKDTNLPSGIYIINGKKQLIK